MAGSIRGMPGLRAELARLPQIAERIANDTVTEWSRDIRADARARVTVLTGLAQANIDARTDRGQHRAEVGVWNENAVYAEWLELGNSRQAPQPFLGPAAAKTDAAMVTRLARASLARQGLA